MEYYFLPDVSFDLGMLAEKDKEVRKRVQKAKEYAEGQQMTRKIAKSTANYRGSEKNPIPLIISFLDQVNDMQPSEEIFQLLGMLCWHPKFFIDRYGLDPERTDSKDDPSPKWKGSVYRNYKMMAQKFYQLLEDFQRQIALYDTYVQRGTKELDRQSTKTIEQSTLEKIKQEILSYYQQYRVEVGAHVKKTGSSVKLEVNETLLENCCTNPWLYPLAHIILTRDCQYQLMGRQKYKKQILLTTEGQHVWDENLSTSSAAWVNDCTFNLSQNIRATLDKFLREKFVTNITCALKRNAAEQIIGATSSAEDNFLLSRTRNFLRQIELSNQLTKLDENHHFTPFQAISFDVEVLAVYVGASFGMDTVEIKRLIPTLSQIIVSRSNVEQILRENQFDSERQSIYGDTRKKLKDVAKALKSLLLPTHYYSCADAQKIVQNLKPHLQTLAHAKVIHKGITSVDLSIRDFYDSISDFMKFWDLTQIGLWASNALHPLGLSAKCMPLFVRKCMKELDKAIVPYLKFSKVISLMEDQDLQKRKKFLKNNPITLNLRYQISQQMNLKAADIFLKKTVFPLISVRNQERQQSPLEVIEEMWGTQIEQCLIGDKQIKLYAAFDETLIESFNWLKAKIHNAFLCQSVCFRFNTPEV